MSPPLRQSYGTSHVLNNSIVYCIQLERMLPLLTRYIHVFTWYIYIHIVSRSSFMDGDDNNNDDDDDNTYSHNRNNYNQNNQHNQRNDHQQQHHHQYLEHDKYDDDNSRKKTNNPQFNFMLYNLFNETFILIIQFLLAILIILIIMILLFNHQPTIDRVMYILMMITETCSYFYQSIIISIINHFIQFIIFIIDLLNMMPSSVQLFLTLFIIFIVFVWSLFSNDVLI